MTFCIAVIGLVLSLHASGFGQESSGAKASRAADSDSEFNQPATDWFYKTLAINYVALNALDLLTTFYSLDRGAQEGNPIARTFVRNRPLAILITGGVTGGVLVVMGQLKNQNKRAAYVTLGILNVVYGLVLRNNIGVVLNLK
ncbi:MAG: DUF5658 family protein [bacterium]